MKVIDLRSDTVTKPTAEMRAAMAAAEVGDDVYGEDPTVNRLKNWPPRMLGKEAALFVCSGTQSNLLALLSHCERGDEYIVGQQGHTYKYEGGGAAVLGSIQPQPLDYEPDGSLDLDRVEAAIKPDDSHFAKTRLLCLENTQGGKVLPLDYLKRAQRIHARARAWPAPGRRARLQRGRASAACRSREISSHFDSVSVCLSKGLGAPVGSVLCGPKALIAKARRWRKVVGGGMRQAGVLAAAGIYALEHNVERLAIDHENARALAERLPPIDGVKVAPGGAQTNMLYVNVEPQRSVRMREYLKEQRHADQRPGQYPPGHASGCRPAGCRSICHVSEGILHRRGKSGVETVASG